MFQIDKINIYKLEGGQNHSIGVLLLGFGAYLERKGLSRKIGTHRKFYDRRRAINV
jgi:hypothetical protein